MGCRNRNITKVTAHREGIFIFLFSKLLQTIGCNHNENIIIAFMRPLPPAQTQYQTSNPTATRAYRGRLKHGVCPFNVPFYRPDTDPAVCKKIKHKEMEKLLQHPVDLPSRGAAMRRRAFGVCVCECISVCLQLRQL